MNDQNNSAEEQKAHQEHLKRQKQHKKKRKQQIIGLVLECVLLVVVIAAYVGVSYADGIMSRIHRNTNEPTTAPVTTTAEDTTTAEHTDPATLPVPGESGESSAQQTSSEEETEPTSDPDGREKATWVDADGNVIEIYLDPTEEYTNPSEQRSTPERDGYYTFVAFGVDARDPNNLFKWVQGDVCIIISLNLSTYEIKMMSVFRDTFLQVANGQYCKLTDCYAALGVDQTVAALNRNFDLQIEDYVVVNWKIVADIVDAMGGLDVEMTEAEARATNDYIYETELATGRTGIEGPEIRSGVQHLNGVNVVCFSRIRYNVGSDYARTSRQRYVIGLMLDKLKTMPLTKMIDILDVAVDNIGTNLESHEIIKLALDYNKYNIGDQQGFPNTSRLAGGAKDSLCSKDLVADVTDMHKFLYGEQNYQAPDIVKDIAAAHLNEIQTRNAMDY